MSSDVLFGWLTKRGQKAKNWKRRYVVVRDDVLYYYKSDKEALSGEPAGQLPLAQSKIAIPDDSSKQIGRAHAFAVITSTVDGSRTFWAATESAEMTSIWAQNLAYYCKRIAGKWPIFGSDLGAGPMTGETQQGIVPWIVVATSEFIDRHALSDEGIYRLSGNHATIQSLKEKFNTGNVVDLEAMKPDANVVAGLLKQYLRELKDPLLTFALYSQWIAASRMPANFQMDEMQKLVKKLPLINASTLRTIVMHLGRVADRAEKNKMGAENLGTVIGPNVLRPSGQDTLSIATDSKAVVNTVAFLISNRHTMFAHLPPETSTCVSRSPFPPAPGFCGITDQSKIEQPFGGLLLKAENFQINRKFATEGSSGSAGALPTAAGGSALPPPLPPSSPARPHSQTVEVWSGAPNSPYANKPPPPPISGSATPQGDRMSMEAKRKSMNRVNKNVLEEMINRNSFKLAEADGYIEEKESDDDGDDMPPPPPPPEDDDDGDAAYSGSRANRSTSLAYIEVHSHDQEPRTNSVEMSNDLRILMKAMVDLKDDINFLYDSLEAEKRRTSELEQRIFELEAQK